MFWVSFYLFFSFEFFFQILTLSSFVTTTKIFVNNLYHNHQKKKNEWWWPPFTFIGSIIEFENGMSKHSLTHTQTDYSNSTKKQKIIYECQRPSSSSSFQRFLPLSHTHTHKHIYKIILATTTPTTTKKLKQQDVFDWSKAGSEKLEFFLFSFLF